MSLDAAALVSLFSYAFVRRALAAGCLIALCCAVLGVFLVLRRLSLIGEGLAHFSLAPIGLALLMGWYPLYLALPVGLAASAAVLYISRRAGSYADAAIGMVSAVGVAGGVTLASTGSGFNVDLFSYLFGDILAVSPAEVWLAAGLAVLVLVLVLLNFHSLFAITFDEEHAKVLGIRVERVNAVLILLATCTVILGIRLVGTMLVSSLIIFPAMTALRLCRGFTCAIATAAGLAVFSVVCGILLAFYCNTPAGAAIVLVNFCLFALVCFFSSLRRLL